MSEQKIAFITGANRGIGFETAKKLGKSGIFPVIGSRNEEAGKAAVEKLKAEGIESDFIKFDVSKKEDYITAYNYFESKFGKLDILVNNAGIGLEGEPASVIGKENATSGVSEEVLRGGYFGENKYKGNLKYFTAGAGVRLFKNYGVDFSYLFPVSEGSPLAQTLRVSLSLYLDDKNNQKL